MNTKFSPLMKELWELTGEIGAKAEEGDDRYSQIYAYLSDALDEAEQNELIVYTENEVDLD